MRQWNEQAWKRYLELSKGSDWHGSESNSPWMFFLGQEEGATIFLNTENGEEVKTVLSEEDQHAMVYGGAGIKGTMEKLGVMI